MTDKSERDWRAIRFDYEHSELSVTQIEERYDVSRPTIYAHAGREEWALRRPSRQTGRKALIHRLIVMLERQIRHLEINMSGSDEKEVTLLGNMARTLEKLIDLDRKNEGDKPDKKRDREIDDLRQKLADRIDQLRKD